MNIVKISRMYKYKRKVESIGGKAALFALRRDPNNIGGNYLFSYTNNVEKLGQIPLLPLELWIRSYDDSVENLKFFIEKANLIEPISKYNIEFMEYSVHIDDERFNDREYEFWENISFNEYIKSNDLYVISKSAPTDLIGYKLDDDHYILFDKNENFCGTVFKNLTKEEFEELNSDYAKGMTISEGFLLD